MLSIIGTFTVPAIRASSMSIFASTLWPIAMIVSVSASVPVQ